MTWKTYIEEIDDGYRVAGSRVSLDSIVHAFRNGQSPESIVQSFDTLSLEQVYGAITFYLAHREEIDAYLEAARAEFERLRETARAEDPAFYEKIARARLSSPA